MLLKDGYGVTLGAGWLHAEFITYLSCCMTGLEGICNRPLLDGCCHIPNCPIADKMVTWRQYLISANDRNRERGRIVAAARSGLPSILMLETMKIYIAGLLLGSACLVSSPAFSLEPCQPTDDYVSGVNKIIDNAVGQRSQFALTVIPSFHPEYGIRMVGNDVYLVELKTSFWGDSVVSDRPTSHRSN